MISEGVRRIFRAVGFVPTATQEGILASEYRSIHVFGGEQSGKSLTASKKFLKEYPRDLARAKAEGYDYPLVYWLVGADYSATRKEFNYIVGDTETLKLRKDSTKNVNPGTIELYGPGGETEVLLRTISASDPVKIMSEAPMGIIVCEAAQLDVLTFLRLIGRMAPHKAWLFMSGTMEGSVGWYPALGKSWQYGTKDSEVSYSLPSHTNTFLYPGGENDPEILRLKEKLPEDFFAERFLGVPCLPKGVVFKSFLPTVHIREVAYEPGVPVQIWIDPGYGHACAYEIIQVIDGQIRVFDELFVEGIIVSDAADWCMQQDWWKDVTRVVGDQYAAQHHHNVSVKETWDEKTGTPMETHKARSINDTNARFASFLKVNPITEVPGIVFSPKCRGVLSELGAWANPITSLETVYKWKTDNNGLVIGVHPEQLNCDGITAIEYGMVVNFGYVEAMLKSKTRTVQKVGKKKSRKQKGPKRK